MTEHKTRPFLNRSLLLTTALVALIVAASFWLGWRNKADGQLVSHTLEVRTNLVSVLSLVQSAETGQRGYLLTGQDLYLGPYQSALQQLPALLDQTQDLTGDNPRQQQSLAQLRTLIHEKFDELRSTIDAYKSEKKDLALAIVNSNNGFQLMAEIRRVIDAMEAEEDRLLTDRQTSAERSASLLEALVVVSFVLICVIGYLIARYTRTSISALAIAGEELSASNAELREQIRQRELVETHLRVQHTVAQVLAEAATIEEVTPRILRAMGECLGTDVGALWRVDRKAEALRCVEFWHKASIEVPEFERLSREFTFVPGLGLPGRVWFSHEPEYIPDVVPDKNFPRGPIAEREGLHAAFGFPILLGREVLGVIEFFSREFRQPDQELLNMLATIGSQIGQFIERKRAEAEARDSEYRYREVQAELAHASRVATMGQLTASISHEVRQPIHSVVLSAETVLALLNRQPPDLEKVRHAAALIVRESLRAGEIIDRVRSLVKKGSSQNEPLDINALIREIVTLTRGETVKHDISIRMQLADGLPLIEGDRIQLQQVILNLIINAIEALSTTSECLRELRISTEKAEVDGVLATIRDSGPGMTPAELERLFEPFYTTKPDGLGMGLSICRSIVEAHGGRLWAETNEPRGAVFKFTLPAVVA